MSKFHDGLTNNEWLLLECLWENSPKNGRETVEYMKKSVGWSRSTTLTMLRRMTEKGLVECEEKNDLKMYSPLVERQEAVVKETQNFLSRVYKGSISVMMSAIAQKQDLTREEIEELYEILDNAKKGDE
ncbi:MAG: BlaI/MecI/CopY family transcriptional regulator [Clostridia bacterium]|nr:BlaI/MecI/CopY family transcriptional regulator [Clostridia bacterium]